MQPTHGETNISPDLTPSEREENKLRKELKKKNTGGENLIIRHDKIVQRKPRQEPNKGELY